MEKMTAFMESKIAPIANKLARQKYLQVLQNTFLALIPFFTIGSFALILISPPMDYSTMNPGIIRSIMYGWAMLAGAVGPVCGYIYLVCMTLMSLWVSIGLGYNLSKHYKINSLNPIIITVSAFFIAATLGSEGTLSFTYLDGSGLFTSILVSIFAFELYRKMVEKKVGYINLEGGSVPPALVDSIGNLVPTLLVLVVVAVTDYVVFMVSGSGLPMLMTIIMTPLVNMVDSIGGILVLSLVVMIFWWFGIHDTVITGPLTPFLTNNFTANMSAFAAGTAATALPFIVTEPFWWTFMAIGGSGATLGLAVLAATSKSKQIRTIGRVAFIPSLFNINEPLIFGLPIMFNPSLMIPFVLVMPMNAIISYVAMSSGLIARTFADASWNMFCPIGALIATMDVKAMLLVIGLIIVDTLIYFPFFKMYEKQKLEEEKMEA